VIQVKICCGLECTARGGQELLDTLESDPLVLSGISLIYEHCMDSCRNGDLAPVVTIEGTMYTSMTADRLSDLLHERIEAMSAIAGR